MAKKKIDFEYLLNVSPEKAVEYLEAKGYKISRNWLDIYNDSNNTAFTIAGVMKEDILKDVKEAIIKSIKAGMGYETFQKHIKEIMQVKGWYLTPWRLKFIYQQNLDIAYSMGRFEEQWAVKENVPYWQYLTQNDERVRPAHRALHGRVFRSTDPIWKVIYPPSDFNCFPAGTLVATKDGWKAIEKIKKGELVYGGSGDIKPTVGLHVNNFNGNMVRLISKREECLLTPNHRVLTTKGWVRAENINIGDEVIQIPEVSCLNSIVGNIDEGNSSFSNLEMPIPIQRESSITTALNPDLNFWDKNINKSSVHNMIKNRFKSRGFNKPKHNLFTFGNFMRFIDMKFNRLIGLIDFRCFNNPIFLFHRHVSISGFDRFRCFSSPLTIIFSEPALIKFFRIFQSSFFENFFNLFFSFGPVYPLCFDGITSSSDRNIKKLHQPSNGVVVHVPSLTKHSIREELINIESSEGFVSGAPLDRFNSIDSFLAWAVSHNLSSKIINKESVPYNDKVYNLSVQDDHSYCVKMAVVHNCRCVVRNYSRNEAKKLGLIFESSKGKIGEKEVTVGSGDNKQTIKAKTFEGHVIGKGFKNPIGDLFKK